MGKFVGKPIVRIDADVDGNKKASRDMSEAELAHISIMSDFYKSFIKSDEENIYLQNSCFSDKNTHFVIPYNKNIVIDTVGKETITLSKAISTILSPTASIKGEKMFFDAIYNIRQGKFQTLLNNLASDWQKVLANIANEKIANKQDASAEMALIDRLKSTDAKTKLDACKELQNGLSPKKNAADFIY